MKAIIYEGRKKILYQDVKKPDLTEGWSLVKVSYAGICGTDKHIYNGNHPRAKPGLIMGHEFSGYLESSDHPCAKFGTKVAVYPLLSCHNCEPCRTGNSHVCNSLGLLGIDRDGGFAEYVAVPNECIIPLPGGVSCKMGAFIEPVSVAVHALRDSSYQPGDNAIIFGCGTIGLVTAITLQMFGCNDIILVETDPIRKKQAENMGFTVYDTQEDNLCYIKEKYTEGNGFDWVIDCAGVQPIADQLFTAVKVRGVILVIAAYEYPARLPLSEGMFKETSIQFTRVYRKKDFKIAADLVAKNSSFEQIITHVLPASEAQKGFDLLTNVGTGANKVMFCFDKMEG